MRRIDLLRLVGVEIIRFKKLNFFLILNFALGLIGFFMLLIFQQSLSKQTSEKAQIILGGDLSISARHAFTEVERADWEKLFKFESRTQYFSLFAMIRKGDESKLVQVGIFDDAYPLYGQLKLSDQNLNSERPLIWVDPEITELLNLSKSDFLDLGDQKFAFGGSIEDDPTRLFRAGAFAPKVLIHKKYLAAAGLIKAGSTFSENWNYRLAATAPIAEIKLSLEKKIKDPIVEIESTVDSAKNGNKTLKYFTDYLGLVALVALGLCFLCGSYLLQWIFHSKRKNIAIFKTLGLKDGKIISIYLMQTLMISVLSCLLAIAVVSALLPVIQNLLSERFNLPVVLQMGWKSIALISGLGIFGPLLMTVPQILQIFSLHPLQLFHSSVESSKKTPAYYFWLALSIFVFWALAVWQSQSFKIGTGFVGSLLLLIINFYFLIWLIMKVLDQNSGKFSWLAQYSIRGLTRRNAATSLVFITMSLSTLVLSLLPHIKASILHEVRPEESSQIPNLFLFDIQPDQVDQLQKISEKWTGKKLVLSPLVRSRILQINGTNYERLVQDTSFQTRESESEARFRNRGVNLTYRSFLQPSETVSNGIFEGEFKGSQPSVVPGLSVESKYAERVGLKVGDSVTFDVQGLEIKAKVSSLREVRWTSFQPNFFILFPTGILEEAPQIYLTSVSQLTVDQAKKFQSEVSKELKNISIINVTQAVQNSLKYIDQMAIGLQMMAWLAVSVGLFVFIILLNTQIKERLSEMNLMQILGCSLREIEKALFIQFFILISLAITFGILFGLGASFLVMKYLFDLTAAFDFQYMAILIASLIPISTLAIYWGLRPLKFLNPMDLIRQAI